MDEISNRVAFGNLTVPKAARGKSTTRFPRKRLAQLLPSNQWVRGVGGGWRQCLYGFGGLGEKR